jgi:hypothetical protein
MVTVYVTVCPGVTVLLVELLLTPTTKFGTAVTLTVMVGADAGNGVFPPSLAAVATALSVMVLPFVALLFTISWKVTTQFVPTCTVRPVMFTLVLLLFV